MASRYQDWLRQGKRDLDHARATVGLGHFEWASFAAQQAAEKAAKAVFQKLGGEAWGPSVTDLLSHLPENILVPPDLMDRARDLDTFYIPTRYPNAHSQGTPSDYYTRGAAERAIADAGAIIQFCEGLLLP